MERIANEGVCRSGSQVLRNGEIRSRTKERAPPRALGILSTLRVGERSRLVTRHLTYTWNC